jgi:glycosyltransferase involved in cell wall biosynthesis
MIVRAAVLTYRAVATGRLDLLIQTVRSLAEADSVHIVDNGSDDGSAELVESWGGYTSSSGVTTSGHGTNLCARILAATDADICLLSDDDMVWRPGWRAELEAWWAGAPDDVWLTGCHLEPDYPWNARSGVLVVGERTGIVRASTGAASWTYRRARHADIFPIPQQVQGWGDVPACDKIDERGGRICQIDLADHAGHGRSTWGNQTEAKYGHDLEPVRKLVTP